MIQRRAKYLRILCLGLLVLMVSTIGAQDSNPLSLGEPPTLKACNLEQVDLAIYPNESIYALKVDKNGMLWIEGHKTMLYDGQRTLALDALDSNDLAPNPFLLEIDFRDSLLGWIGNGSQHSFIRDSLILDYHPESGNGYFYSRGKIFQFSNVGRQLEWNCVLNGINLNRVTAITRDPTTGIFFLANARGKLYKIYPNYFQNWYQKGKANEARNHVYDLIEVGRDSIFTEQGILFTPDSSYTIMDPIRPPNKDYLNRIWSFMSFSEDYPDGFFRTDSKAFKPIPVDVEQDDPFEGIHVIDSSNTLWVTSAIIPNRKLYYHDREDYSNYHEVPIPPNIKIVDMLLYNRTKHSLLLAAWGDTSINFQELDIQAYENGEAHFIKPVKGFRLSFYGPVMRDIHLDKKDNYWFSQRGDGFFAIFNDTRRRLPYDEHDLLKYPHKILEDEEDYFWISTNNGILQAYRPELMAWLRGEVDQVYYHHYGYENGIESRELNGRRLQSGIICEDGKYVFASIRGPIVFRPENIPKVHTASTIVLNSLNIDGLKRSFKDGIEIEFGAGVLQFNLSAPYLGSELNQATIEYQLSGSNLPWRKLEKGRLVLNNLPEGKYQLKMRIKRGFGLNNFLYRDINFKVSGIWYTSNWFYYGCISFGIVLIIGFLWFRSLLAKRTQTELEEEVKRQTKSESDLNENLMFKNAQLSKIQKQNHKILKSRDRLIGLYIHDIRGPLKFIENVTGDTFAHLSELKQADYKKRIEILRQAANGIFSQSERMFKWITAESVKLNFDPKPIHMKALLEDCFVRYKEMAASKGVELLISEVEDMVFYNDPNIVSIALNNIVENAIKYSNSGGEVKIEAIEQNTFIRLSVQDTGVGMNSEQLEALSKGQAKSTTGTAGEIGKGYGLKAIQELIDLASTLMEIESEEGMGTKVSLFYPKKLD